jgi:fibronectin-binding autotransporter adhesin
MKNRFLTISAAFVSFSLPVFAASGTWNTTTSGALWTLDTNWVGNVIADGSGNTADFSQVDITADTTVALNGTRTIGNLIFGDTVTATAGHWTLNGGANALTLAGATPTITVNALGSGKAVFLNAGLSGTSGFTKSGSGGSLILGSSGNTLSGAVTVSAGTLQLNNASLTNATSVAINGGSLVMATTLANALGGTISFGGGFLQFNVVPGTDYSAQFSTSANQAYKIITGVSTTFASNLASSGGSLQVVGNGNLTLSAANTFNGTTTVSTNNGNLILSNPLALQNSAIDATNSVTGSATQGLVLSGVTTPTFGGLTGTKALSTLFNSSTGGYGSVTNLTLNPGTGASRSYAGIIADGAGGMTLTKTGAGTQILTGANSYTGDTAINAGILSIGNAAALGSTGTISFGGGALQYSGVATDLSSRFSTAASQAYKVDTNGQNVIWASALTSSGGTLTKSGAGTLTLSGGLANTFTGPINVDAGTLSTGNGASLKNVTGPITVASGATFNANQQFDTNSFAQNISIAGSGPGATYGALNLQGNVTLTGAVTLTADSKISHDYNNGTITGSVTGTNTNLQLTTLQSAQPPLFLTGPVNLGTGGVTVTGAGGTSIVNLSGTLNYTGETVVTAGTLKLSGTARMADSSTVRITSGAVLNLDFAGTDTVAALYLGGALMPVGTYGSLASTATNKSADFLGDGILSVSGASSYSTWASANGIPGQPASGDFDNDSLSNIVEYALGLSPTASSVPPGTFNGSLLSFTKGTEAKANGDVTYEIEQSTTLGGWAVVVPNAPASATISYTLPTGQPKVFARLKITQIP